MTVALSWQVDLEIKKGDQPDFSRMGQYPLGTSKLMTQQYAPPPLLLLLYSRCKS